MRKLLLTISIALCLGVATPVAAQGMAPPKPAAMSQPAPVAAPAMAPESPKPANMAPVATAAPDKASPATAAPAKSEGKKDTWWQTLLGGLLQVLLLFVLAFATILGKMGISWLAKKMKITDAEMTKQIEELYDKAITFGVDYANQQAYKLKNEPDVAGKRIEWATRMILDTIKSMGLPEKSAQWVRNKIEAKIGSNERKKVA